MQPQPPGAGDLLAGKYRLERVLGEGGFGRVLEGTDETLGRQVAVKLLKPTSGEDDVRRTQRFLREMRAIAQLNHPNVVALYDYGRTEEGFWYMVFERVGGRDLADVLEEGPIDEPTTIHVLVQLLAALEAAHTLNLLHRDIKPENIRVYRYMDDPWCAKLLDFGLAKNPETDSRLTSTGKVIGTPRFMAPEQLRGKPLTAASDLYSLGLVAFEMLTGTDAKNLETLANGARVRLPVDVLVSDELRQTVDRMLEVNPAARFQTARDVARHLPAEGSDRSDRSGPGTSKDPERPRARKRRPKGLCRRHLRRADRRATQTACRNRGGERCPLRSQS